MRILVGLSGGVDSAVSAYLLQQAGHDVSCGYMVNYLDEENPTCTTKIDMEEAKKVATHLGLPLYIFDYRDEYEKRIIDYIYREYMAGNTPNPDVYCNNLVKFDLFLEEAMSMGYDAIATGHYARTSPQPSPTGGGASDIEDVPRVSSDVPRQYILCKGVDETKDQSYFLSRLSTYQLAHSIFPIGHLHKSAVRDIAVNIGLPNAYRKDSQGLCFIGKVSMRDFLAKRIPEKIGNICDTSGQILGTHTGVYRYTIGQRKGIEIGGGPALYILSKDVYTNTLVVGTHDEISLYTQKIYIHDYTGSDIHDGGEYTTKIRYRQPDQICTLHTDDTGMYVVFDVPQRAVASGQICVVYSGDTVVGSGVIV